MTLLPALRGALLSSCSIALLHVVGLCNAYPIRSDANHGIQYGARKAPSPMTGIGIEDDACYGKASHVPRRRG